MRRSIVLVMAAILGLGLAQNAQAAFFGYTRGLADHALRIKFDRPALPPFAHSRFCLEYSDDCRVRHIAFRGGKIALTIQRWMDLIEVNTSVNRAIIPEEQEETAATEKWLISPARGDCSDYAVTKRHELLAHGWPSRALLLAEVVTAAGEHHLVLVIRAQEGDYVADNLNPHIRAWYRTGYRWIRIQTPGNPQFWANVAKAAA